MNGTLGLQLQQTFSWVSDIMSLKIFIAPAPWRPPTQKFDQSERFWRSDFTELNSFRFRLKNIYIYTTGY